MQLYACHGHYSYKGIDPNEDSVRFICASNRDSARRSYKGIDPNEDSVRKQQAEYKRLGEGYKGIDPNEDSVSFRI